jgi:uncharacterized repeat protein (TIGR01451 family)
MKSMQPITGFLAAVLLIFAVAGPARPQATLYTTGDPAASTTVVRGKAVCGTSTTNMSAIDGMDYATYSASEFAAATYELRASVPNPMGRDTGSATAGRWGLTIVNPTRAALNVTAVEILDVNNVGLFNAITAVQPATGWARANNFVRWTGSIDVPAHSSYGFVVQIQGRSRAANGALLRLSAATAAGTLERTDFVTTQSNNDNCPYVSLPFAVNGFDVFTGNEANGGSIETGTSQTFSVKVVESEQGNHVAIPAGTTLTITIPPGWTGVNAAPGQTGFDDPAITDPQSCMPGSIVVHTTSPILLASQTFLFGATAPANQGGTGLYLFTATLQNGIAVPPIDTVTEFVQEVRRPPSTGTRAGITQLGAYLSVPNPMGSDKFSTWGVAVANPLDTPYTVTSLEIGMPNGEQFFKAVTAITPATGWTRVSTSIVRWTGSVTIDPHEAANFTAQIQANNKNGVDKTVRVTVNGSLVKEALTTQHTNNPPAVSLYYLAAGRPVVYTFGSPSGERKTYQAVIRESQNVNIIAGAELKIIIPAGWSNVDAPLNQTGFTNRTIVQPTPATDGSVITRTSANFKNKSLTFTFSAVAPPDLLASLFVLPTTLTSTQVRSICDMVTQVVDATGGLRVEHLSPPIPESSINQIDIHAIVSAVPDTVFSESIYNFATASWEPMNSLSVSSAPLPLLSFIEASFEQYFDEPLYSPTKHMKLAFYSTDIDNHRFNEDYIAFIVSEYRVVPVSVAPENTFRGSTDVPMLLLGFETEEGMVDLHTLKAAVIGSDPANDVTLVHLIEDLDCDGTVGPGESDLYTPQLLDASNTVTFGDGATPLLTFHQGAPKCAIIALDISPSAGAFDVVHVEIASGFDLTSSVGPVYPFPALGGFPIDSDDSLIPGGPPSLLLEKTVVPDQSSYPAGSTITYQVTVENIGESPSTDVNVFDELDPIWAPYTGVITPLNGGSVCLPPACPVPQVVWPAIPMLAGGSMQTVTLGFQARIPDTVPDGTGIPNVAQAVSTEEPEGVTSNEMPIAACGPVLSMTKSLPGTQPDYAVDEFIQWNIGVRNTGGCAATHLLVTDSIDDTLLDESTITLTPPGGTYNASTNTISWNLASVAAGAVANLSFSARILPAAEGRTLCNIATATWDQGVNPLMSDPPGGSCTSVAIQPPRCQPNLVLDKTLPLVPCDYAEGETIVWTITMKNNGNCAAPAVVLRDTIDTTVIGPPFVFTPNTGTYDAGSSTYTWPALDVAGNGTQTVTFTIGGTLLDGAEGKVVCDTAIADLDGTDITSNPSTGSCTSVPVLPGPRCSPANLIPATALKAVKSGDDIVFDWVGPSAPQQHLNVVTVPNQIPNARRSPVGAGTEACTGTSPGCTVPNVVSEPPDRIFYKAGGACGPTGSDEGAL